jgi:hypothetical protein
MGRQGPVSSLSRGGNDVNTRWVRTFVASTWAVVRCRAGYDNSPGVARPLTPHRSDSPLCHWRERLRLSPGMTGRTRIRNTGAGRT